MPRTVALDDQTFDGPLDDQAPAGSARPARSDAPGKPAVARSKALLLSSYLRYPLPLPALVVNRPGITKQLAHPPENIARPSQSRFANLV